jgi:Transglycosylase-like domain
MPVRGRPEDVMVRPKTTTALAAAAVLLAVPAADAEDPLKPAVGDHETLAAQMRAVARENRQDDRARRERREAREHTAFPTLEAIAACESGGNPRTDTGNGFYGKYQFTLATWSAVGGTGNPAHASEAEQDRRAAILYAREGALPWPVCGR